MKSAVYIVAWFLILVGAPLIFGAMGIAAYAVFNWGGWWLGAPALILLAPFAWKALRAIRAQELRDQRDRHYY